MDPYLVVTLEFLAVHGHTIREPWSLPIGSELFLGLELYCMKYLNMHLNNPWSLPPWWWTCSLPRTAPGCKPPLHRTPGHLNKRKIKTESTVQNDFDILE